MPAANGSAVKYYYALETDGAISATVPDFLPIRFNTSSLARTTAQVDSNEINENRQRPVAKQGTYSIAGEIVSELSDDSFDALIEAAMQGTWTADVLKVGSTVRTFAILKRHTDTGEDYLYSGCRISTMAVAAQIDARVGITFGIIGTEAEVYTVPVGATFTVATTTEPMVTSIGSLTEGGVAQASVTSLDFTLDNGMAPLHTLFQRAAYDVQNGVATVSGTLSAFREDGTLYAKFLNEAETAIVETFSDGANTRAFTFPKVIYVNADDPVSGPDAIVNQFTFSAGYDGTAETTLTITRSA